MVSVERAASPFKPGGAGARPRTSEATNDYQTKSTLLSFVSFRSRAQALAQRVCVGLWFKTKALRGFKWRRTTPFDEKLRFVSLSLTLRCFAISHRRFNPPAQRQYSLFSVTRMGGAKQLSFCGALARVPLIGVLQNNPEGRSTRWQFSWPRVAPGPYLDGTRCPSRIL